MPRWKAEAKKREEEKKAGAKKPQSSSVKNVNKKAQNSTFMGGGTPVKKAEKTYQAAKKPSAKARQVAEEQKRRRELEQHQNQKTYGDQKRSTPRRTTTTSNNLTQHTTAAQRQKMGMPTAEDLRQGREHRRALAQSVKDSVRRATSEENRAFMQRQKSGTLTSEDKKKVERQNERRKEVAENTGRAATKGVQDTLTGYGKTLADVDEMAKSNKNWTRAKASKMGISEDDTVGMAKVEAERQKSIKQAQELRRDLAEKQDKRQAEFDERTKNAKGLEKAWYGAVESGTGMATDALVGALTGTGTAGSLASMAVRTYGTTRGQAEKEGATENEDRAYAVLQAAKEVGTELLFPGAGLAKKAYGKAGLSVADRVADSLTKGMTGNKADLVGAGVRLLGGTAEENAEELAGWGLDPVIKELTYAKNVRKREAQKLLKQESDELRSNLKSAGDARSVAAYLGSDRFLADNIAQYKDAGLSDKQAREVAEKMRDYLTASLTGDTDRMGDLEDEIVKTVAGGSLKAMIKDYDVGELIDTFASTSVLTLATGLPATATTAMKGARIRENLGSEGLRALSQTAINFEDDEASLKGQAARDRLDSGKDLTSTQVYDLAKAQAEQIQKDEKRVAAMSNMADNAIKSEKLVTPKIGFRENGSVAGDEIITMNYVNESNNATEIISDLLKEEGSESLTDTEVQTGSRAIAGFKTGAFTVNDANALNYTNTTVRTAFEAATGVNLSQYVVRKNGQVDIPATNAATKDALFAMAADNFVKTAQAETANWMDSVKGDVVTQVTERMGAQGSLALQQALDDVDERDRSTYMMNANAADMMYQTARNMGTEWDSVKAEARKMFPDISETKLEAMYNAGLRDRADAANGAIGQQVRMGETMALQNEPSEPKGKVFVDTTATPKGTVVRTFSEIASNLGVDIHLVDDLKTSTGGQANGQYVNGAIYINMNSDFESNIGYIFMHEVTHHLKQYAPEQFNELENLVREKWFGYNPEQMQNEITKKIDLYKRNGQTLSEEEALEEIIADAAHEFINDRNFADQVAEQNPDIAKAILNGIRNALRMLRRLFAAGSIDDETHMNSLFSQLNILDEAEKLWLNAYTQAVQNKAAVAIDEWQDRANKASISTTDDTRQARITVDDNTPIEDLDQHNATVEDDNGDMVAEFHDNGSVRFSISSFDDKGRAIYKKYLNKMVKAGEMSQQEADDMMNELETVYKICKDFADKVDDKGNPVFAPYTSWSYADVVTDEKGKPVFSAIKKNSEYKMNIDFSTICKKRRTLDAVFREMISRGLMEQLDFNKDESAAMVVNINNLIRQNDFEAACALCFVEARRYRQQQTATTFRDMWNDLVESMYKDKSKIAYFNFGKDSTVEDVPDGIHTMDAKDLDLTHIKEIANARKEDGKLMQTAEAKAARLILKDPSQRKLMRIGDMMASTGFENMQIQNPKLMKIYNAKKGTGGAKSSFGDVQYLNEIINSKTFDRRKAYAVSGVRIQSFSDYVPRMVFDYVQVIADLAAKKLPAHAYTKEVLFAQQFGLTGAKINLSLVPDVVADGVAPGLDAQGNYIWNEEGTFPFDEAMRLQEAEGYKENCGTIAVGISDEQIIKMLADPKIQMVIPYHKSSLNPIVAAMTNVDRFENYEKFQTTKDENGNALSKDFDWDNKLFELSHDKDGNQLPKEQWGNVQDLVKEYADWCKEHNYTPKFPQFLYMEDGSINPGYYKLLEDFALLDNKGNFKPQGDVQMRFPTEADEFGSMQSLIEQGLTEDTELEANRTAKIGGIVDRIKEMMDEGTLAEQSTTSEKLAAKFSISPEMDDAYMDAVNSGDMEEAQRLVNEAAKSAGYNTPRLYHGTPSFGFTTFDLGRGENIIFATSSPLTAETYSGETDRRNISDAASLNVDELYGESLLKEASKYRGKYKDYRLMTPAEQERLLDESRKDVESFARVASDFIDEHRDAFNAEKLEIANRIVNALDRVSTAWADDMVDSAWNDFEDAVWDLKWIDESIQMELTQALQNNGSLLYAKNRVSDFMYAGDIYINKNYEADYVFDNQLALELDADLHKGIYGLYGRGENQLVIDANGSNWNQITPPDELNLYGPQRTRSIAEAAKAKGYDSVLFKNLKDNGGGTPYNGISDVYMFFNPNQVKSADPVTYAEDGSAIPLSERFDPTNNDIRYSLPTTDADGNVLTDGQMEYFKDSKARDEFGRLVPVYHTTNDGGFTVFDPEHSDDHRCLFFSSDYYVSQSYGENAEEPIDINRGINEDGTIDVQQGYYKVYLNLENPMVINGQGQGWDDITIGKRVLPKDSHIEIYSRDYLVWSADNADYLYKIGQAHRDGSRQRKEIAEMGDSPSVVLKFETGERIVVKAESHDAIKESVAKTLSEHYNVDEGTVWKIANTLVTRMGLHVNNGHTWLNSSMINKLTGETHTTREWAEIAQAQGHDGVIFKNIVDIGSWDFFSEEIESDIYVAFSSNQVKDINNENPTENPDIRYSITDDDEAMSHMAHDYAYDNSYEALAHYEEMIAADEADETVYQKAKNYIAKDVDEFYAGLTRYADGMKFDDPILEEGRTRMAKSKQDFFNSTTAKWNDRWLTDDEVLDIKSVKKAVRDLVTGTMLNSNTKRKYSQETVKKTLIDMRLAYFYAKQGRTDIADALLWHSAHRMIDGVEFYADDSTFEEYKGLRDYLKNTRIQLGEEYWSDVDYAAFRKENYGRLNLVKGETNVDKIYAELEELFPGLFDSETYNTAPDQLLHMAEVLDSVQPYAEAYSSEYCAEWATDIASDLLDIMQSGKELQSTADKYKKRYDEKAKAMKARHAEAMMKVRQQRDEGIKRERVKFKEYVEKKKEKQAHNKYFDSIQKSHKKLTDRLLSNTADSNIPQQYKKELAKLLAAFDLQTVGSKKVEARRGVQGQKTIKMAAIKTALNNIESRSGEFHVSDAITDIIDELLGKDMGNGNNRGIEGMTIDELNSSELARIDKLLKALVHEFNTYKTVKIQAKRQQVEDIGKAQVNSSLEHAQIFGQRKDYQNITGVLDKIVNMGEMTPAYMFRMLDPNNEGIGLMWKEIRRSFDRYVRNQNQLNDWMDEIIGEYHQKGILWNKYGSGELSNWRSTNYQQTFVLTNGAVTLTPAQMMSLYCLSKRNQAYGHMVGAGIVVAPVSFQAKIMSDVKKKADMSLPVILTDADIKHIVSKLTPDQIKVADKLQELMATKMAAWGNEASMNVLGIELFGEPDYFPIKSDKAALEKDLDADQFANAIRSFGFTKAVQPGARNAIMIDDIFDVVAEHCNNMNLYNSYSEAMNDFMKVYNYRDFREDGREYTVQQAIAHAYSRKATTYIMQFMKDLNGNVSGRSDAIENAYNTALGNAKKAAVFANLRVAAQQPTAIVRAFAEIDPKYIKGIRVGQGDMKEMMEHCPIALWKSWGYYDINMGKSIEDIMMNNGKWLEDKATDLYGALDNVTWTAIWQMVKAETRDKHPELKEGTDEFFEHCNERMSEIVDFTQVVDSPMHRSHDMRSKNMITKLATSFMAEPTLTFNMVKDGMRRAYEEYEAGSTKKAAGILQRTFNVFIIQAGTVAAFAAAIDALRKKKPDKDDEDDRFLHLWWVNALENFKDNLKLWNNIYFVKDIASMFEGWDNNNLALQGWKNLATGWNQLTGNGYVKSSKAWYENMAYGLGYLTGIPAKTIMTGISNFTNMFGVTLPGVEMITEELDALPDAFKKDDAEIEPESMAGKFISIALSDDDKSVMDKVAEKMGYKPIGSNAVAADKNETKSDSKETKESSADIEKQLEEYRETLSDNLSEDQKDKLVKQYKKTLEKEAVTEAAMSEDFDVQAHIAEAQANFDYEMEKRSIKAAEMAAGKTGRQRDEALWDVISEGYTKSVESGNMATIQRMREEFAKQGGDTEWFDAKIADKMKSAYKKTLYSSDEIVPGASLRQETMYNFMTEHGVSEKEISDIVYHSYVARDLKAAMRIGNEDYILDELVPLVAAGLSREDYEKLYKYRNMGAKTYDGKYTDPKYTKTTGTFVWPTEGVITSHFGYRNAPTAGASSNHPAIDIGAPSGTTVVAADGGVVITAGANGGYGNSVGIKHANGMVTYYNHLSAWNVKVGDQVAQGQPIANVGSTGISTGPHLDFKILDADGNPVDPEKYLNKRS